MKRHLIFFILLMAGGALRAQSLPPLITNGGFENGMTDWSSFIPAESEEKNCQANIVNAQPHSGGACLQMFAGDFARFAVSHTPFPVAAGNRYRLTLWFRAGPDSTFPRRSPAIALRITYMKDKSMLQGGRFSIDSNGVVTRGNPAPRKEPPPETWTKIEAVIEASPNVNRILVEIFSFAKGSLYIDDLGVEQVDATTPVSAFADGGDYRTLIPAASVLAGPPPPAPLANPGPVTKDADIIAALNTDLPGLEKVKAALAAGRLAEAQQAYLDYRRAASPARWKILPTAEPPTPTETKDPVADQIIGHNVPRGAYHYGPPVTFMGNDFNWTYNPVQPGDPSFSNEFTYCVIARTEWWQNLADAYWKTHDERYAQCWVDLLQDFARKNPMDTSAWQGKATVWRTLDTATRMDVSWPYAYFHFLNSPSFTSAAQWTYLKLMRDHADRLVEGLKDQSRSGNWVTDECCGLYTIGVLFPELRDAAQWRDIAINRLVVEFNRTVEPDGFEAELTPGYHYGALSQFRAPYDLARLNQLPIPDIFKEKILSMYRAPVLVMEQNGQDVCTNDSWIVNAAKSAKQGLEIADDPLLEWAASGGKSGTRPPDSTMLPYAGFYAMRSGWAWGDLFLFFRAGPPGIGHEHQDMLEVVLRAWDTNLLIDPGTYSYDRSNWRRYVVNTPAHNTIIVDGKWQHRPPNTPPVTVPVSNPWVTTPLFDFVAGTYDAGYQENVYAPREYAPYDWVGPVDNSVTHTRRVLYLRPYYALVLDTLDGTGRHTFEAHWSIDEQAAKVDPATQSIFASGSNGVGIGLFPLDRDNLTADVVQGQKSPTFLGWLPIDHQRAIPTARFIKEQDAPATFATFLYPYKGTEAPALTGASLADAPGIWTERLTTPRETAEVAIVKDAAQKEIAFQSQMLGPVRATAAGLIIRRPSGGDKVFAGGWDLSAYADSEMILRLDRPVSVIFTGGQHPLLYNADAKPVTATFTQPVSGSFSVPAGSWIDVSNGGRIAASPEMFAPLNPPRK